MVYAVIGFAIGMIIGAAVSLALVETEDCAEIDWKREWDDPYKDVRL